MIIKRRSVISGSMSEMDIDILPEQLKQFDAINNSKWLVPSLSDVHRRFLLTGMTEYEQRELDR